MNSNEIYFFNEVDAGMISDVVSVENSEYLQLDVTGSASNFKINVYAQVTEGGEFLPLAIIGNSSFKIYNSITTIGFYKIDTTGILNVRLNLSKIESGSLTCLGVLVLKENLSEWESINNKPSIEKGNGLNSIIEGNDNEAIGDYSHAEGRNTIAISESSHAGGYNTIAGIKGYYFSNIDFDNKIITLTKQQGVEPTEAFKVDYAIGDVISLNNGSKFQNCATIMAIENNLITVNELPFTSVVADSNPTSDEWNFYVLAKPTVGECRLGLYATAIGENSKALERDSYAEGRDTIARGQYAHAEGRATEAAYCAHAEGRSTKATNENAHAEGASTIASGIASHAEGRASTTASGLASHAEGHGTTASDNYAHSEGMYTKATNSSSHAEGIKSIASGLASHAEGEQTNASNDYSHSEGYKTTASGISSHAEGSNSIAQGEASHAEGSSKAYGNFGHAEGSSQSWGNSAHAEGYNTISYGNGSHSEGVGTQAGNENGANNGAHAEGHGSQALGSYAHAEGASTLASGQASHAEGSETIAKNNCAHAEGRGTETNALDQHVEGRYNKTNNKAAHIVGNGKSETATDENGEKTTTITRSNAHVLTWEGNAYYAGDVYVGDANDITKAKKLATEEFVGKTVFSGNYNDLKDTPQLDWNENNSTSKNFIKNRPCYKSEEPCAFISLDDGSCKSVSPIKGKKYNAEYIVYTEDGSISKIYSTILDCYEEEYNGENVLCLSDNNIWIYYPHDSLSIDKQYTPFENPYGASECKIYGLDGGSTTIVYHKLSNDYLDFDSIKDILKKYIDEQVELRVAEVLANN